MAVAPGKGFTKEVRHENIYNVESQPHYDDGESRNPPCLGLKLPGTQKPRRISVNILCG